MIYYKGQTVRKGLAMARIEKEVTLRKESAYERRSFSGYGYETVHIYKMTDADGTVYVWKTTAHLVHETIADDSVDMYFPQIGDVIKIRATVKGETEYNGEPQTEINRVKVTAVLYKYKEVKYAEQMASIKENDFIWYAMPYKQYKTSYSDCEVIIDSFNDYEGRKPSTVDVIIREGRIKASGTRRQKFAYYLLENENGKKHTYKAIDESHAIERAERELGGNWSLVDITDCNRGGWVNIWR